MCVGVLVCVKNFNVPIIWHLNLYLNTSAMWLTKKIVQCSFNFFHPDCLGKFSGWLRRDKLWYVMRFWQETTGILNVDLVLCSYALYLISKTDVWHYLGLLMLRRTVASWMLGVMVIRKHILPGCISCRSNSVQLIQPFSPLQSVESNCSISSVSNEHTHKPK